MRRDRNAIIHIVKRSAMRMKKRWDVDNRDESRYIAK